MAFNESHFPKDCPICKGRLADHGSHLLNSDRTLRFPCDRCGGYTLAADDEAKLPEELRDDSARLAVSYYVRHLPRGEDPAPLLRIETVRNMRDRGLPTPKQQADNLIRFVGTETHSGQKIDVSVEEHLAVLGCRDAEALEWVVAHLVQDGLLTAENVTRAKTIKDDDGQRGHSWAAKVLCLTMKGWTRYEELTRTQSADQVPKPAATTRADVGIDLGRLHSKIMERCQKAFDAGLYNEAIFNALKAVEDEIRTRIGADATDLGVELVSKAMGKKPARLVLSSVAPEQEAGHLLFRGAIGFLKNPQSHRFVGVDDPVLTFEVLAFASFLMRHLDGAELRPNASGPLAAEGPPPHSARLKKAEKRSGSRVVVDPGPRIVLARAYVDEKEIVSPYRELIGRPYVAHAVFVNDPPDPVPSTVATDVVADVSFFQPDGTPVLEHIPGRWEHMPVPTSHYDPPEPITMGIGQPRTLDLAIKQPGARVFAFSNESYRARGWQYEPFAFGAADQAWRVRIRLRGPRLDQTFELALIDSDAGLPLMMYATDIEGALRDHPSLDRPS